MTNQKHSKVISHKLSHQPKDHDDLQVRKFPLYIILTCGIVVTVVGLWLTTSNTLASGTTLPSRYGQGGGQHVVLNGPFTILIGILICIFPAFQLIKKTPMKKN